MMFVSKFVLLVAVTAALHLQCCGARNLTEILKDYDKEQLPPMNDGPIRVDVTAYVLSIPIIDSAKQTMTVDFYFRQRWRDTRLRHDEPEIKGSSAVLSKIWVPDTFFVNEIAASKHEITTPNTFVKIDSDGVVLTSSRFTLTTVCAMDFTDFPFDTQECEIRMESYAYKAEEVEYAWKQSNLSNALGVNEIRNMEFKLVATKTRSSKEVLSSGSYIGLHMDFMFRRLAGRYYNEYFYPCVILSFIAILSMVAVEPLVSIGIHVIVICFIIILTALVSSDYPNVSTATVIDSFGSITSTYVLLSFILSLVAYILKGSDLGPEVHELSNFRDGRVRLGNDERVNLCTEPSPSRTPESRLGQIVKLVGAMIGKVYPLLKLTLLVLWGLTNFFYLTTRPLTSSVRTTDELKEDFWKIHGE